MTRRLMVQGVNSGAGKTTVTAAICRYLSGRGLDVVPFKAENVSLNSFVTNDGKEMAISQAYQAWACGKEPSHDMNPILIKPKGGGQCQIVLNGRPWRDIGRGDSSSELIDVLRENIQTTFDQVSKGRDAVVLEGMGSPVEMNLKDRDVSNMWLAKATRAPVILVGDIEKGGVFAGIYGTYLLLDEEERDLVNGFLINRFRGDPSILSQGIEELESRMGVPCLGVLPYVRFSSPMEDSLDIGRSQRADGGGEDIRQQWMKDLDRLLESWNGHMDWKAIETILDRSG